MLPINADQKKLINVSMDSLYLTLDTKDLVFSFICDLNRLQKSNKIQVSIKTLNLIASVLKQSSTYSMSSLGQDRLWIISKRVKDETGMIISRVFSDKIYKNADPYQNGDIDKLFKIISQYEAEANNNSMITFKRNIRRFINNFIKNNTYKVESVILSWFNGDEYKCTSTHARKIIKLVGNGDKISVDSIMQYVLNELFGNNEIIRNVEGDLVNCKIGDYIFGDKLFTKKLLRSSILRHCIQDSLLIAIGKNSVITKMQTKVRGKSIVKCPLSTIKNAIFEQYPVLNTKKASDTKRKRREFNININTIVNEVMKSLSAFYKIHEFEKDSHKFIVYIDYEVPNKDDLFKKKTDEEDFISTGIKNLFDEITNDIKDENSVDSVTSIYDIVDLRVDSVTSKPKLTIEEQRAKLRSQFNLTFSAEPKKEQKEVIYNSFAEKAMARLAESKFVSAKSFEKKTSVMENLRELKGNDDDYDDWLDLQK